MILVRRETNPDDLPGMIAAEGILTSRGGKTSHAAVVARGHGQDLRVRRRGARGGRAARAIRVGRMVVHEGDVISIDGTTGEVYLGEVPVLPSPVVRYFEGELAPSTSDQLVAAVHRLLRHADGARGSACGPTPTPPRTPPGPAGSAPRASGCAGPSTCSWGAAGAGRAADPGRRRRRTRGRAGRAAAVAARGLRRDLRGHGRAAR